MTATPVEEPETVSVVEHADALRGAGVDLVLGTAVDYSGVARAKGVPLDRLAAFVESGMGASPSWVVFCVDFGIAFTPDLGVAGDLRLRLDPDRLTVIDDGIAWAPTTLYEQDGSIFAGCPRARLQHTLDRCAAAGLTVLTGAEFEFTLMHPDGSALTDTPWQGYGIRTALNYGPLLTDLVRTFDGAGVPIEQIHTEYGDHQVELSLAPADPLTTADNTVLARILIGRAAARAGYGVSFSPQPFLGGAGNGAHLHLSLTGDGRPLLSGSDGPHGISTQGGAAIAGILGLLPELQAVIAGSTASALRLRPGSWSGAFACWGLENREAAVRFIAATESNPHGANIEVKAMDSSANPYLAAAVILGAALDGIDAGAVLPAEVTVDPATLPAEQKEPIALATDQATAVKRFAGSSRAAALLGASIAEGLLSVRRYELSTYGTAEPADVATAFRFAYSC